MKVYVLMGGWNYEGVELIDVFLDREKANEVKRKMERKKSINFYDYFKVEEKEVIKNKPNKKQLEG